MKTLIITLTLALGLTFGTMQTAQAQAEAAELKIAVVDIGSIFQQLPQRQEISEMLQEEFRERIQQVQAAEEELAEQQERLQRDESIMSEEELEEASRDFQMQVMEHRQRGEALQEEMQERQQEERNRLLNRMGEVVRNIAEEEGFDVVLEANGLAYARDGLDISSRVLDIMTDD